MKHRLPPSLGMFSTIVKHGGAQLVADRLGEIGPFQAAIALTARNSMMYSLFFAKTNGCLMQTLNK